MIGYESALERDFFILLEFDDQVASYEEQPTEIGFRDEAGRSHKAFPDVLVKYTDPEWPPTLFDVKYSEDVKPSIAESRERYRAVCRFARSRGWRYRIVTERLIRGPYVKNATFLLNYRERVFPRELMAALIERLDDQMVTIRDLIAEIEDEDAKAVRLAMIWHMVCKGELMTDLNVPLTQQTRVGRR